MNMATPKSEKYRLGLDLGTNSIGWSAVRLDDNGEPNSVLDMGVRIFPDGRNPTDKASNAVDRRLARGQRRRRDRYLRRRRDLTEALIKFGLMPQAKAERKEVERFDPYELRARALDHLLKPYELGRALFHLNQRRGFKSNRKAGGDDEKEARRQRVEIDALRSSIKQIGARTLGEFLARRLADGQPVRARPDLGLYPDRTMYEEEFDAIRAAQEPHHDLSGEQWNALKGVIFFQRPFKPVDQGWCQLEPGQRRAAKALSVAQEFRMFQEVNNLRIRVGSDPERPLDQHERERLLKRLRSGKDLNLQKPTRDLGLPSGAAFNLAAGGRKTVKGDETTSRLMKAKARKGERAEEIFGDRWLEISLDERNDIVRFMLDTEEPDDVRHEARDVWGLNEAQAEHIAHVNLVSGYASLSERAIRRLLPHLKKGRVYSDAVIDAGYPHHSDFRNAEAHERLPYYGEVIERAVAGADPTKDPGRDSEAARYGRIGNPTVHIGLGQLRRVVNRLIKAYGKPEKVVVELGRDLKMNREQKENYLLQQQEGGKRNERLRKELESVEIDPTAHTLMKLRLWEEQGPVHARVCPYTGSILSFEMVVCNKTEIDHILPFSRTLDDSTANKVVCVAVANRDKGDRSPHEAFSHNPPGYDYQGIFKRAANLPVNKRWRFQPDAMDRFEGEHGFLGRQLNETRYLSSTARAYLAHLYDEKTEGNQRVRVIPGRMTALLRRGWGLEGMLRVSEEGEKRGKQRDDHRHHAIDAFVVANTTQGLLQRFAQAAASTHVAEEKLAAVAGETLPWDGFHRDQLRHFLDRVVVSHKPDHGTRSVGGNTTGQLHNETAYGLVKLSEHGPSKVVVRRKLADIKKRGDLKSVRDSTLRAALLELWDNVMAEGGNSAAFAEKASTEGVSLNGTRRRVQRVRVVADQRVIPIRNRDGEVYKGFLSGGNEFADIWRMRDGNWKLVAVPTFDANQTDFDIEKFRPLDKSGRRDPVAKRLMRLQIDDMGALGEGQDRRIVRVRKITNARDGVYVVLDGHNEANVPDRVRKRQMKEGRYSARQLQKQGFRKVRVDEIGRVLDPGPR